MPAPRPSPTQSATAYKVGRRMAGNDGATYEVVAAKNGVKRWKKVADEAGLKSARIVITPFLVPPGSPNGEKKISVSAYLADKRIATRYEDIVGKRPLDIVRSALRFMNGDAVVKRIVSVSFDMAAFQYVADVRYEGAPKDLRVEAREILDSGRLGSDTWMEGDITVNGLELFLKLARVIDDSGP